MRSSVALVLLAAALCPGAARAQEGRFDVQMFRPSGEPQDLVMVSQSRPLSHLSVAAGLYLSYSLDPLVLVAQATGQKALNVVGNRLELDAMGAIGFFNWFDIGVAIPLVLYQDSGNLADTGTEGTIQSFALGDVRLTSKIAIPGMRRLPEGHGFGMAATLGVDLPTGSVAAFTSDGVATYQGGLILDYRFKFGMLIALNAGVWIRPSREWNGLKVGDMLPLAAAIEMPIVRRWGFTLIGEAYTDVSLTTLIDHPRQAPLSALFGARWYGSSGITITVGLGGGCDCSFGAPSFQFFTSIIWVPGKTREYEAIEHFKQPPPPDPDPDHDQVIGSKDRCPTQSGPVENYGCPDTDQDHDQVVDRLDECPTEPGAGDPKGCPEFRIVESKIKLREQIYFYTDSDVIKPESLPLLDRLTAFLIARPELDDVRVGGHTDVRASHEYNQKLSEKRARAVVHYLVLHGVHPERLQAKGYGETRPLVVVSRPEDCVGVDPEDRKSRNTSLPTMNDECIAASQVNRRIEFTIEHTYQGNVLPAQVLPPSQSLPANGLPSSGLPSTGLPKAGLPATGLPRAGLPMNGLPTTMTPAK